MTGCNSGGDLGNQNPTNAVVQIPESPKNLKLTPGNHELGASWSAVSGAQYYYLYFSKGSFSSNQNYEQYGITRLKITGTSAVIGNLTNGVPFYIGVTAVNGSGESTVSAVQQAVPKMPAAILAAPTNFNATAADASISLSWSSVAGAKYYQLYYGLNILDSSKLDNYNSKIFNGDSTAGSIDKLKNGQTYYLAIASVNSDDVVGSLSGQKSAFPQAPTLSAPTGLIVLAEGDSQLVLSWNPVEKAKSYNIYYSTTFFTQSSLPAMKKNVASPSTSTYLNGLSNNQIYYVAIAAINSDDKEGQASPLITGTPKVQQSGTVPTTPGNFKIVTSDPVVSGQLSLSWNAVLGATSYRVYYAPNEFTATDLPTTSKSFGVTTTGVITGLENDRLYSLRIVAINNIGDSAPSAQIQGTPTAPAAAILPAPTGLTITAGDSKLDLLWNAVAGAFSYRIYYSTAQIPDISAYPSDSRINRIEVIGTNHSLGSLDNLQKYHVRITAVNGDDVDGEPSTERTAIPSAGTLLAPTGLVITVGNKQLDLVWNAVTGAESYNIYYAINAFSSIDDYLSNGITRVTSMATSHSLIGLNNGQTYHVRITAVNADGIDGGVSAEKTGTPTFVLSAPQGFVAEAGDKIIYLVWDEVTDATGYKLYYAKGSFINLELSSYTTYAANNGGGEIANITANEYVLLGLSNDTTYYLRLIATKESDNAQSAPSAEAIAKPERRNTPEDVRGSTGFTSAGSGCVTDDTTGLTWEVKNVAGGMPRVINSRILHGSNTIASAYDSGCTIEIGDCNTDSYIAYVNSQQLCGFTDWRLPTLEEAMGIMKIGTDATSDSEEKSLLPKEIFPYLNASVNTSMMFLGSPFWTSDMDSAGKPVFTLTANVFEGSTHFNNDTVPAYGLVASGTGLSGRYYGSVAGTVPLHVRLVR